MRICLGLLAAAVFAASAVAQVPTRSRSAPAPAPAPRATTAPMPRVSAPIRSRTADVQRSGGYSNRGYGSLDSSGTYTGQRVSVFQRPRYPTFVGRVTNGGGGPRPVEPIHASCNCGGRLYDLGYLRFGSGFEFGFGPSYGLPFLQPWMVRAGCDLLLYSPGYRMLTLPLAFNPNYSAGYGYYSTIGKIRMEPYEDVERVSMTSFTAPKEARKAYEKGAKKFVNGDLLDAKGLLLEAVELHPNYAAAWTMLGRTLARLEEFDEARDAFERSIQADSQYLAPYRPLVRILVNQKDWAGVAELAQEGVDLDPYDAELKYQLAVAAMELEDYELARNMAERLFTTDDAEIFPESGYILAKAHRMLGDEDKAIRTLQEYLERPGKATVRRWAREDLRRLLAEASPESDGSAPQ